MIRLLKARLRLRAADSGIAMVMVIGVGSVLTLLSVAAISVSLGTMKRSVSDQDWNGALAAAYAGIEEYQSRISESPSYVKYGNPASTFSNPTALPNPTVSMPPTANPAFGLGTTGTWGTVSVTGSGAQAFYRYEVNNSKYGESGNVRLRSTGRVGEATRSIVADLRQEGFIDYLYFTDFEMQDPSVVSSSCPVIHTWEGRGGCTIQFASADVIGGPVHSNDTLYICGSRFKNTVSTGWSAGGYVKPGGCSNGVFDVGPPVYNPPVPMPATNTELRKETRSDLTATEVPRPGCLYTGPTSIVFISGGRMTVKSPWTKFTSIVGEPVTAGNNLLSAQCGTPAALQSSGGATVPVPQNNVIYVQNIPLTGINSATSTQTSTTGSSPKCKNLSGATLTSPAGYSQNILLYPTGQEKPLVAGAAADASYGCRNGDVFVQGQLSGGAVTIAAQNYVYITNDLTYANTDNDMLGLVGQNAVWVYNPMNSSESALLPGGRTIHAAILSVAHTFTVQNYDKGSSRGTLTVYGSIAQKFRGAVATTGGTGYTKSYNYDPRFRYTAPPKFLSPVTTTYGVNVWVEIAPVFEATGAYK